jgi:hypothetical protein
MLLSSLPYKFQYVWASGATAPTYITTPIPATSVSPAASQQLGWPPATANPSGTPPNINDMNGVLNYLSLWAQWVQAGGPSLYDATFSTNIGGYPNAALVGSVSYPGVIWLSTADNNTSDPDTGGANWKGFPFRGVQVFTTNGTFTVPAGVTTIEVELWGGGGGSGGTINGSSGAGGGAAGGYARKIISGQVPGNTFAVVIGSGGAGGNNVTPTNGAAGGTTSFGAVFSASGGNGGNGANGAVASLVVVGGTGTGGDVNVQGGGPSQPFSLGSGTVYGANGGAPYGIPASTTGWSNTAQNGSPGFTPGGGAAGPVNGGVGQPGGQGEVIVRW